MLILPIIERIVLHYSLACVNMSKILCCYSLCSEAMPQKHGTAWWRIRAWTFMWALNSKLLHLYNTECSEYKKKNEPKVLLFSWLPLTCWLVYLNTYQINQLISELSRKEVFQPHLPVRLPCYDLAPITSFALGRSLRSRTSGTPGFHGLTGGVYKARERIHRAMADGAITSVNPASWGGLRDPSPNWDRLSRLDAICITPSLCTGHCTRV